MGKEKAEQLCFQGKKVRWISPVDLKDLIRLKAEYPNAPLLVGNTTIGWKVTYLPIYLYTHQPNQPTNLSDFIVL